MTTLAIDRFGRVVIPKDIRDRHGWVAGTTLVLREDEHAVHLEPTATPGPGGLRLAEGRMVYEGSWVGSTDGQDPSRGVLQTLRDERTDRLASVVP
jgi:AbrB family looped-hinge helix DNA binding protein